MKAMRRGRVQSGQIPGPGNPAGISGLFDVLSDDEIMLIAAELMRVTDTLGGLEYLSRVEAGRKAAVSLMLACKRISALMGKGDSPQAAELRARAMTKIMPRSPGSPLAFSEQVERETRACAQLRFLRAAQRAMACHCAKACCLNIQKAFNKDVSRGCPSAPRRASEAVAPKAPPSRLVPATESCSLLAPSSSGTAAFAYRRKRVSKLGSHGEGRGKRYEDEIVRIELAGASPRGAQVKEAARVLVEEEDTSSPLFMRSSADGSAVAWVCAAHEVDAQQEVPFSRAFVWDSSWGAHCALPPPDGCAPQLLSAQDAWFVEEDGRPLVVVAWSTDFFHPSGHHVGSWSNPGREIYVFATYSMGDGCAELCSEGLVHQDACLISCSPARGGGEVLALVKREDSYSPRHRYTVLHDVRSEATIRVPHNVPSEKGPLCAAISPTGDCVVAMHKTERSLMVNVQVRSSDSGFTPVQKLDLSPWLALSPWNGSSPMHSDLVKASFCVRFSPCGRFFYVQDTRPLFGEKAAAHGLVVVDMARRMDRTQFLRAFPMFPTDEQAPRSVDWTEAGFWLMPPGTDSNGSIGARGGALCLVSAGQRQA
jgi:hypothetical protein